MCTCTCTCMFLLWYNRVQVVDVWAYLVPIEGSCSGVVLVWEAHSWRDVRLRAEEIFSATITTYLEEQCVSVKYGKFNMLKDTYFHLFHFWVLPLVHSSGANKATNDIIVTSSQITVRTRIRCSPYMNPQTSVLAWALETDEDAVADGDPLRVTGATLETTLQHITY